MFVQSLWALAAAALFSCLAAFVKLCSGHFSPFELVFYRSIFGAVLIAAFVVRSRNLTFRTPHLWGNIKRSIGGTLSVALWFLTLEMMPLSTNITLTYTTPLFMAANFVLLALWHHSKAPWGLVGAVIAGFIGVVVTLQPTFGSGMMLPALGCLGTAFIDLLVYWQIKQLGDMGEPTWRIVFYFTLFGTLFSFIGTLATGGFHTISWENGMYLIGMGICGTVAQLCTTRSYAKGNMLLSSCLGFSAIVFSGLISWIFFAEPITGLMAAGMLIILIAGVCATIFTKRREAQLRAPRQVNAS